MRPLPHFRFAPRQALHSTPYLAQYHFDTQALVSKLESEGLSRAQAVGITTALEDVVQESVRNMVANLVTRQEQEKVLWTSV